MLDPDFPNIAYYKNGNPYTADGQIIIMITRGPVGDGNGLGNSNVDGSSGGKTGGGTGGSKLDLSYATYRGVITQMLKQIEQTNALLKTKNDDFIASYNRERAKNNEMALQYKNIVQIKHIDPAKGAHEHNMLMQQQEAQRVALRGAILKTEREAEAAKKAKEEAERKVKEAKRLLKLEEEKRDKWLASLSPEVRVVAVATRSLELAKSELAKVDADIQSKRADVTRSSAEVKEAQTKADSKPRGFSGWRNLQNKLDERLQTKKNEYAVYEKALNTATTNRIDKAKKVTETEKSLKKAEVDLANAQIKKATDATVTFYESVTAKYGKKYSLLAQDLANKSKGKKISNINEALAAFEKYRNVLDKKFSKADRDAISKALEAIKYDEWAKHLDQFSKYLKLTGYISLSYDVVSDFITACKTNNWRPLFLTLEKTAADIGIGIVVAFAFSMIAGTALSILGIAIITGILCSLIDKNDLQKLNEALGI